MKRSPFVAVGTVVGLASVLSFHTTPVKLNLSLASGPSAGLPVTTTTSAKKQPTTTLAPTTTTPPTTLAPTTTTPPTTTTTAPVNTTTTVTHATTTLSPTTTTTTPPTTLAPTTTTPPTTTTTPPTTTTTPAASGVRSVTGPPVNYYYGVLSVKVTANGQKITGVTIASINDGGNPQSQQIDQYSIPILQQEALSAQSGSIQSVSGASYTSAGFQLSLQNALKKLGI